jgi:3',5'-nucleoside bisphosphate phosphatase
MTPAFDLQSHSTHSDGSLPAAEVVARAAGAGVKLLALTDHDTVAGVSEAVASGEHEGIRVLPAVEISSIDNPSASVEESGRGGRDQESSRGPASAGEEARETDTQQARELHILGYLIDHDDPCFEATLTEFLADRERRTLRMADALRGEGFELDDTAIAARVAAGQPIGRPHLAEAVLAAPANAGRLREEDIDDVGSLIRGYLIEGRSAFRLRETPSVPEAVDAIHAAGGVAVWAHPFWDVDEPEEALAMVQRFRELGIDGIEAFYVTHTREQTELLATRCAELDLLSTGSSDFHGPENRLFSRFLAFETHGLQPNLGPLID